MLFRDPSRKEYTAFELKLIAGYHIQQDLVRGSVPIYWDESDRVAFDVKVGRSKSRRAIEMRQERDKKKKPAELAGLYYYAVPRSIDGDALPTLEEWAEEKRAREGNQDPTVG